MGRLPDLWLQKAVSVLEHFPEGCVEQLTWPSALLRKTLLHIPCISKRNKEYKGRTLFSPFSLKKDEGEEYKTHFPVS